MEKREEKLKYYLDMSPFNPVSYEVDSSSKILVLIQRLSWVMRKLIWDKVKNYGISATQAEILLHILFNPEERRKLSIIAREFGISKPTVSRAINIMIDKGLIEKKVDEREKRSHILNLTQKGIDIALEISSYGNLIADIIKDGFDEDERREVVKSLISTIQKLVEAGVYDVFPSCVFCRHLSEQGKNAFWCDKLEMVIMPETIRLNCEVFEPRTRKKITRRRKTMSV